MVRKGTVVWRWGSMVAVCGVLMAAPFVPVSAEPGRDLHWDFDEIAANDVIYGLAQPAMP
ncbi:hypothetical protein [Nocardia transvalensis]|uniref:hypothetical protein n=1 Tax=Nocardia transvalensis TaxID=37333 RepID=UPI001894A28D|nr:hypothetical protein [Nocardia transvalensis]MBF6328896.1 hypothetical protein [Nocardia transvalensis]